MTVLKTASPATVIDTRTCGSRHRSNMSALRQPSNVSMWREAAPMYPGAANDRVQGVLTV